MAKKYEQKEHAYKKFGADLKAEDFPQLIFMYGPEQYLIEWATESLIRRYVDSAALSFDLTKLDEAASVDEILQAADMFPMCSERKVVYIRNHLLLQSANPIDFTEADKEKLIAYLENPNEGSMLIFSCEQPDANSEAVAALKRLGRCYGFDKLDYAQLSAFVEKRFRSAGVGIDRGLIRFLIDETGYFNKETDYRIFNLENDIKKLIAHSDGGVLSREDITECLNGDMDTFIFNFLDAAANRRRDTAFTLLHNMLRQGSGVFPITAMLVNQFELLLDVKELREDGLAHTEIAKLLKAHEFRVKKAMALTDKFSKQKLKEILCQLYETDRNIKTGILEPELALELLVGRI